MKEILLTRGCTRLENDKAKCDNSLHSCNKLDVFNWLEQIPTSIRKLDIVEVRFKHTRKGFYQNVNNLHLKSGDLVAVEATPGHDIGIIALTGELLFEQMRKYHFNPNVDDVKKIYRKAKPPDVDKWLKSIELENDFMIKARTVVDILELKMKIGDVEFQGDGTKAIFYYIADERVDFRELIKILAEEFKIRVEMRQIGARQEAGRIGGIGACGRELCCSTWMTHFASVTTNAARYQELSLNPQKLAGQCGKLKCCLNFEVDDYIDAQKDFPDTKIVLETSKGKAYHQKNDIFRKIMWYSYNPTDFLSNIIPVPVEKVCEIIEANRKGQIVPHLGEADLTPSHHREKNQQVMKMESDRKVSRVLIIKFRKIAEIRKKLNLSIRKNLKTRKKLSRIRKMSLKTRKKLSRIKKTLLKTRKKLSRIKKTLL